MKKASLLLILVSALLCGRSYAQTLEPCRQPEFLAGYYRGVDRVIDNAVGQTPSLSLTTLPSFWAESGVRIVGSDVYFVEFKSSFWGEANSYGSFASPRIETKTHRAAISPELASRIEEIYAGAIAGASQTDRRGVDGVSYRFSSPRAGCGETWSPEPDTVNARLVELLVLLSNHAKLSNPRDMQRSEESMVHLIRNMDGR